MPGAGFVGDSIRDLADEKHVTVKVGFVGFDLASSRFGFGGVGIAGLGLVLGLGLVGRFGLGAVPGLDDIAWLLNCCK